jgi:EpsI family protein
MRFEFGRSLAVLAVMLLSAAMAVWFKPTHLAADMAPKLKLDAIVPKEFAGWTVDPDQFPIPLDPETRATIDRIYDQVLERSYIDARGRIVMLSVVYVTHSEKYTAHRPEVCYPAHGFTVERDSEAVRLKTPAGIIDATRLVARRGSRNEPITYWMILGGEQTRFGMPLRRLQVLSGFSGAIPDGLLVRISTIGADANSEFATQEQFASDLIASVEPDDRQYLLGVSARAVRTADSATR